jgi:c-di-GMP-binding flagellar brake protein YcgR
MATASAVQDTNDGIIAESGEIQQILLDLHRSKSFVTISMGGGKQLSTMLLDVDSKSGSFTFEGSTDPSENQAIASTGKLHFSASLRGVSVRFSTSSASQTTFEGSPALCSPMPQDMQYMQRREYYRTTFMNSYTCALKLGKDKVITLDLKDISVGGIGLSSNTIGVDALPINTLADATLDFEKLGKIAVTLMVTSHRKVDNAGKALHLYGCRFSQLERAKEAAIQRLVFQLQQINRANQVTEE